MAPKIQIQINKATGIGVVRPNTMQIGLNVRADRKTGGNTKKSEFRNCKDIAAKAGK